MQAFFSDFSQKRYNSVSRIIRKSAKKELMQECKLKVFTNIESNNLICFSESHRNREAKSDPCR